MGRTSAEAHSVRSTPPHLIHYRIQSVGRQECLDRLLPGLPPAVEVVIDDGPPPSNPWRGYQLALANLPDCSHVVVLQEDAVVCRNFEQAVERVVEGRPDTVTSLFVGGLGGKTRNDFFEALQKGHRFCPIWPADTLHVVALVWPRPLVDEFLAWVGTENVPFTLGSDDRYIGYWAKKTKQQLWAVVPNLVEHPDDLESTWRVRKGKKPWAGKNRGRVAIHWIGDADPLELLWE